MVDADPIEPCPCCAAAFVVPVGDLEDFFIVECSCSAEGVDCWKGPRRATAESAVAAWNAVMLFHGKGGA